MMKWNTPAQTAANQTAPYKTGTLRVSSDVKAKHAHTEAEKSELSFDIPVFF